MTLDELKTEIKQLPSIELYAFARWLDEYMKEVSEREIESEVDACFEYNVRKHGLWVDEFGS